LIADVKKTYGTYIKLFLALISISIAIYFLNRFIDYLLFESGAHPFKGIFATDPGNLTNTLGGLGEVVTAVLGVELTAVAIIAQLAANKYSSNVMILFILNKINIFVVALFVLTSTNTILVVNTITEDFITYWSVTFDLILIVLSILIVIPHLYYVFNFLQPENFIGLVQKEAKGILKAVVKAPGEEIPKLRDEFYERIEFVRDIGINSVSQGDSAVAILCITSLKEIISDYFEMKAKFPEIWFRRSGKEYLDPDFSGYSRFVIDRIEKSRTFIERKVFRAFDLIFNISRKTLRDVAAGVLLNSGLIGQKAIELKDEGALECTFRYFNSYLRFAINDHDPRSAFNTLEHYRVIAEKLLDEDPLKVEQIAYYFKYYALEAQKHNVLFILETAAHDLCVLNELAYKKKVPNIRELLLIFLNLDQPIEETNSTGEISLIGVRIAQVKLAGFYLINGEKELARLIYEDMKVEPRERILRIYELIYTTTVEEFWEITPRGINFYYLSPERREALKEFFEWFEDAVVK
jgi:hypothetical protein